MSDDEKTEFIAKSLYARVEIDREALETSRDPAQSWVKQLEKELHRLRVHDPDAFYRLMFDL